MSIYFASLCLCGSAFAVQASTEPLPGRLFYTPAQRAMLVDARAHKVTSVQKFPASSEAAPVRFEGLIRRSDGEETRWVNGRVITGSAPAMVRDLKPGQTRAAKKVYEPYQLLRPVGPSSAPVPGRDAAPTNNEAAP